MTDPAAWPAELRSLVEQYGPGAVWRAGLMALEFPPTWATTVDEFRTVREAVIARSVSQPVRWLP